MSFMHVLFRVENFVDLLVDIEIINMIGLEITILDSPVRENQVFVPDITNCLFWLSTGSVEWILGNFFLGNKRVFIVIFSFKRINKNKKWFFITIKLI